MRKCILLPREVAYYKLVEGDLIRVARVIPVDTKLELGAPTPAKLNGIHTKALSIVGGTFDGHHVLLRDVRDLVSG